MNCAPAIKGTYTCLTKDKLINIANIYNTLEIKKNNKDIINIYQSKKKIWESLVNRLGNEKQWTELSFIDSIKSNINSIYKPIQPEGWKKNKHEWLSTTNINSVMNQYENKYNDFKFLGAVPSDCHTVMSCSLAQTNIINLYKNNNVKKIGIVFNIDKHYQNGSHWVSLFININKSDITYFDSYGLDAPNNIKHYINQLITNFNKINVNLKYNYNNKRHQYGGSECGVYSMYFILQSLNNKSIYDINSKTIKDKDMNLLRNYLYRIL